MKSKFKNIGSAEHKLKISELVPSVILAEITISGNIYGDGAIDIAGKVIGDVRAISVRTGVDSVVHGNITAERVEIHGEVHGNITAKKIICGANARVKGNILHSTIHIETGASIDGNCRKYVAPIYSPDTLLEHQDNLVLVNAVDVVEGNEELVAEELIYVKVHSEPEAEQV